MDEILNDPIQKTHSRTSGDPLYIGRTSDGRLIAVVFERVDETTAYPITAYTLGE